MNIINKKIKKLISAGIAILLFLFIQYLVQGLEMKKLYAAQDKIRVGYFHVSGYQELDDDGRRSGFGYDYLQEIAKYTGWKYEFVDATWDECLLMLKNGEIDLMSCARKSPEREAAFELSEYRLGLLNSVITVRVDDQKYNYNDFEGFDGLKVGVMKGNRTSQELDTLFEKYGISMQKVFYKTEDELRAGLYNKEIDAIASSNQRIFQNEKIIANFNSGPFFALMRKGNTDLKRKLDDAMERLMLTNPYFEAELYEKYFEGNAGYKVALSKEEKEYVQGNRTLRIATSQDSRPVCYYDGNKYTGIIIDYINKMAETAGLIIEYVKTDSYKDSMELLKSGQVDAVPDFYSDYSWAGQNGVVLTTPYLDVQYVEISAEGKKDPKKTVVAACEDFFFNEIYIAEHYSKENIIFCRSESDCVDAVRTGKADITFVNQYSAKALLEEDENLKLSSTTLYDTGHKLSIAVPEDNKTLCYVLDKAIINMETAAIDQIVEDYVHDSDEKISLTRYIYYNSFEVLKITFVFICIAVIVMVYIMLQRKKYNRHIYELAYTDSLTGLGNVNKFESVAEKRYSDYKGKELCLFSLDISHFTTINETYGRMVGDLVITFVGKKLGILFEEKDVVARNKVDTFLLLTTCTAKEEIDAVLSVVKKEISVFHYTEPSGIEYDINLTYNFGIVKDKCTGSSFIKKLIDRAEMARKASKKASDHIQYFNSEMEQKLLQEKAIEDNMKQALENHEFEIYYQPKYCMTDNSIMGAEALIRWNSRELGFMDPGKFIPVLESNGFIIELDFYVMEQVYKLQRRRMDEGKRTVRISINQSRMHFAKKNYIERLNELRTKYRIPDELIELELTESIFADMKDVSKIVEKLKSNNYYLSVDDFGSGYSSLNMIKEIPLDALKIDKDFLNGEKESGRYQKVIEKVVELARELNMDIICEGVEEQEQADFLKSVGCLYAQGFLYARPMTEDKFNVLLEEMYE